MRRLFRTLDRFVARLRGGATVPTNSEVDDELRFHLEMEAEALRRHGLTSDRAADEARRRFGGVGRYGEEVRDVRGGRWLEWLGKDLRHAGRLARRVPLHTTVVVVTLGVAIGANAAIFSVVDAALLRPLPFPNPERIVSLYSQNADRSQPRFSISYADFLDWQRNTRSFAAMASFGSSALTLAGDDRNDAERMAGLAVTSTFFEVLGARAGIGRLFGKEDAIGESSDAIVLTAPFWRRRFGGDSSIVGRSIALTGRSRTVIGVLSEDFRFDGRTMDAVIVLPPSSLPGVENHAQHLLEGIARLRPDVTLEAARQDLSAVAARLAEQHPDIRGWSANVFRLQDELRRNVRKPLVILLAAAGLVLLIGCINVANLQMTRGASRSREVSLRQALGASRGRVATQLLVETAVLAVAGGVLGIAIAAGGARLLLKLAPPGLIPNAADIRIDGRVLAFAMALSFLSAVLVGVWPALRASRTHLARALQDVRRSQSGALGATRFRRVLVVAETALALVLVVCAALTLQSLRHLLNIDPGFRVDRIATMRLTLSPAAYPESAAVRFYHELTRRLVGRAGIDAVAAANTAPLAGGGLAPQVRFLGTKNSLDGTTTFTATAVTPGYFRAAGIRLIAGRDISWDDASVALLVSESVGRRYWPGENVLGKRIAFGPRDTIGLEIVGVVAESRARGLTSDPTPMIYMAFRGALNVARTMTLLVRGSGDEEATVATTRAVVRELDPRLALYNVQSLRQIVDRSVAQPRLNATLLAAFAVMALLLATIGIYGVVSYLVAQRTQELGVRIALGAQRRDVLRMVLGEGAVLAGIGVIIGVGASFAATRVIRGWLFGIEAGDAATLAGMSALIVGVALLASYIPARRATRVDPLLAIRAD